jgi:hypothetical protein
MIQRRAQQASCLELPDPYGPIFRAFLIVRTMEIHRFEREPPIFGGGP